MNRRQLFVPRAVLAVLIAGATAGCSTARSTGAAARPVETSEPATTTTPPTTTGATTTAPATSTSETVALAAGSGCRAGDPLANVYHPYRLQLVAACATVSGTVESIRREQDGDVHFDLAVDTAYAGMVNDQNRSHQHGWLVVELVPADERGCTPGQAPRAPSGSYDYGTCTGADETTPPVGTHATVTGPYVLDREHGGWAEIHPAWRIVPG